ncbi:hypothetical protein BDW59DRAFT_161414 [Aspergillus cavernicola]|uniref:Nucleotidyltransferase family protein n=1 Tax=Aspergillus cavernicola TaxID=176166 RepID=A0ABR4IDC7_9EURO
MSAHSNAATKLAANVARVLDGAQVPNLLWGWAALGFVQPEQEFPDLEFVIPDGVIPVACHALKKAGYTICEDKECGEFMEDREDEFASLRGIEPHIYYHHVAEAHFHPKSTYLTISLLRQSKSLPWLEDMTRSSHYLMISHDPTVPGLLEYFSRGRRSLYPDQHPIKMLTPAAFTESIIRMLCWDIQVKPLLMFRWLGMFNAVKHQRIFTASLRPNFQAAWNMYVKRTGNDRIFGFLRIREQLIVTGELPELLRCVDVSNI